MIENTQVYGLENSLRVAGFPMQVKDIEETDVRKNSRGKHLGSTKIGEGHDNFLLGIVVQFDLSFTNKAWVEAERYHFFDIVSSQSTMHRITKFDLDTAYIEYTNPIIIATMKLLVGSYNRLLLDIADAKQENANENTIKEMEESASRKYLEILYSNPAGMILKSGMTTNYRQLKTIVVQRYNHRLPEWRRFVEWCFTLPMFEELTGLNKNKYTNGGN